PARRPPPTTPRAATGLNSRADARLGRPVPLSLGARSMPDTTSASLLVAERPRRTSARDSKPIAALELRPGRRPVITSARGGPMFNPQISEEQTQLVDTARKFTAEKIIPVAGHYDELEEFPTEIFREAFELGLMNVEIPEAYGGLGFGTVDGCLLSEELAYGCPAIATSMMCNHLGALPLMVAGSEAQKQKWLTEVVENFSFISYACSEPDAGSDVA